LPQALRELEGSEAYSVTASNLLKELARAALMQRGFMHRSHSETRSIRPLRPTATERVVAATAPSGLSAAMAPWPSHGRAGRGPPSPR